MKYYSEIRLLDKDTGFFEVHLHIDGCTLESAKNKAMRHVRKHLNDEEVIVINIFSTIGEVWCVDTEVITPST